MRKLSFALTPILMAMVATGCQPPPEVEMEPARTAQEVEADFEATKAEWQSLANADDPAGVAALYTADAVFVDAFGNVYDGREAIQGYLEGSFPTASDIVIETTSTIFHGDMVAAYGTFSQTVAGPEGDMTMAGMWQTVSLYQPDGSVKLRMHHSMLPAEPPPPM